MNESDKESILSTAQLLEHIKGEILPPLKSKEVFSLTLSGQEFHARNIGGGKKEESLHGGQSRLTWRLQKSSTSTDGNSTPELSKSFTF